MHAIRSTPAIFLLRATIALFLLWGALLLVRARFGVAQGLSGEYLDPSTTTSVPLRTALASSISTDRILVDWYGAPPPTFKARWFGYLVVARRGDYTFSTTSDDGSRLSIDGLLVVDNGGIHGPQTRTGHITLDPVPHFVMLEYEQAGGGFALDWTWARAGDAQAPVPAWRLSPTRVSYAAALATYLLDRGSWLALVAAIAAAVALIAAIVRPGGVVARRYPSAATLVLFIVLAILETWPLATNPARLSRNDNGDTMLNEWTIAWVAHQAPRAPLHLFDANIFYPERDTLAYSEAMLVQSAFAAPILWLGGSPVLAYNLVLLAGFALTGWATSIVITRWTGNRFAGIVAGIMAGFNAHTLTRLPQLQAQHAEFLPLSLLALDSLLRRPRLAAAFRLAGWFVLQALASVYLLVISAFGLAAAALVRPGAWLGRRFARTAMYIGVAAGAAALVLLPAIVPYWLAYHGQGLGRSLDDARTSSAVWADYLTTNSRLHYALWSYRWTAHTGLFAGLTGIVLAAVAIVSGVAFRDARARMCVAMAAIGVALSFGPAMPLYPLLYRAAPLLHSIRVPSRFGYLAIVGVAMLAGFGVCELRRRIPSRAWTPVAASIVALAIVEPFPGPLALQRFDGVRPIYARVRDVPAAVVAELPLAPPNAIFENAPYLLNSTKNFKPLLNGYSGFVPAIYRQEYDRLSAFPSPASIEALRAVGVTHVFVHMDEYGAGAAAELDRAPGLMKIAVDGPVALYRVQPIN